MKISIITVTYNCKDFIGDYLDSIKALFGSDSRFHLVIVDNASADDGITIIRDYVRNAGLEDRCSILESEQNVGFGRGCNKGAEFALKTKSNFLWFLNPDTKINLNSAEELLNVFGNNEADIVGSSLSDSEGRIRSGAFRYPTIAVSLFANARIRLLSKYTPTIPMDSKLVAAGWLSGASFMLKSDVFEKLGGFDPEYFLYFEDIDLCLRAARMGFKIASTSTSTVFHISGASTGLVKSGINRKRRPGYWYQSRRRFYIKNYGRFYFLLVDLALLVGQAIWKLKLLFNKRANRDPLYFARDIIRYCALSSKDTQLD